MGNKQKFMLMTTVKIRVVKYIRFFDISTIYLYRDFFIEKVSKSINDLIRLCISVLTTYSRVLFLKVYLFPKINIILKKYITVNPWKWLRMS